MGTMANKHFFFDFDDTLVDTSELFAHRSTAEGRSYVANNSHLVNTQLCNPDLVKIVSALHKNNSASIFTNSAKPYTEALLDKHGFPTDLPIYSNAQKPDSKSLSSTIDILGIHPNDVLLIGDSAKDILAGHGCNVASIGVTWGQSSKDNLELSEARGIATSVDELVNCIENFKNETYGYIARSAPKNYDFLPFSFTDPQIDYHSIGKYVSFGHPEFNSSGSNLILAYKDSKEFDFNIIKDQRKVRQFFHGGRVKGWDVYYDIIVGYYRQLQDKIDTLGLTGNSICISAPNSVPEYCFGNDVNEIMVRNLNETKFGISKKDTQRFLHRVYPTIPSRLGGQRNHQTHLNSVGVPKNRYDIDTFDNVIVFDDVCTTRTQMESLGKLLRDTCNFNGNLYGLTLG